MLRAQRLIYIMKLLEEGGAISVEQLSRALGKTERTIWRDIAGLRAIHVPIQIEEGKYSLEPHAWANWRPPALKLTRRRGMG